MYAAKKGGETLKTGARAIRFRDLQNTITAAFKYAVKQCRELSETDPAPDQSRCGLNRLTAGRMKRQLRNGLRASVSLLRPK